MLSVAIVDIWQWTPFVYLVMFAGLQTVPHEAVEAAQVDGASSWAAVPSHRAALPPTPRPAPGALLPDRRRAAGVRPRLRAHRRRAGAATQLLSLYLYRIAFKFSDPAGVGPGGHGHGRDHGLLHRDRSIPPTGAATDATEDGRTRLLRATVIALLSAPIFAFPLYAWSTPSLKPEAELFRSTPTLVPQNPTLGAYGTCCSTAA